MTKKRTSRSITTSMPLRDFLRGGYQNIDQPTVLTYHSSVLGTFVPGEITPPFGWTPSPLRSALENHPAPVTQQPPLTTAVASSVSTSGSISALPLAASYQSPTRAAYRALRTNQTPELPGWLTGPTVTGQSSGHRHGSTKRRTK